jgi:SAM-dependent methyltransferase
MPDTTPNEPNDLFSRLLALDPARPILIWGAGRAGVAAIRCLRDRGIEPAACVDSQPRVETLEGLAVHRPTFLEHGRDSHAARPFIVIASMHAAAIAAQAQALGLSAADDLTIFDPRTAVFTDRADGIGADFYHLLHELRGHAVADLPRGIHTLLSAGCSGGWYFDWIAERYGDVARHIGTEAYRPRPDVLPAGVEWLARDVIDVPEVGDETVDLVFSGQNIEHLWPAQVAGFLLESHRVLTPGGYLALDSPNRDMTRTLGWSHPEHTIEYSVDDIRELLDLAGFADVTVRGIWLCEDRGRLLPLSPYGAWTDTAEILRRAALARTRPESSFVWWAEARKRHAPRPEALLAALDLLFTQHWPERLNRFTASVTTRQDADGRRACVEGLMSGLVATGPMFPLRAGRSRLRLRARSLDRTTPCLIRVEVTRGADGAELLASTVATLPARETPLDLEVVRTDDITFHVQMKIFALGGGPGEVLLECEHTWDEAGAERLEGEAGRIA